MPGALPSLLVGLFAGAWGDRCRRRTFLIAADIGRALLLATVPAAALLGLISIHQLFAVAFLAGALTVVFNVAYPSYLPSVIDRSQLVEGNGKLGLSGSITAVAGPSLGGLVIQAITPMALQGRMHATLNFIVAGMLPLGALAGGALGEVIGVRQTIAVAACESALSFLWLLFSPIRSLTRIPESQAE